jgi:hypothetical protein
VLVVGGVASSHPALPLLFLVSKTRLTIAFTGSSYINGDTSSIATTSHYIDSWLLSEHFKSSRKLMTCMHQEEVHYQFSYPWHDGDPSTGKRQEFLFGDFILLGARLLLV